MKQFRLAIICVMLALAVAGCRTGRQATSPRPAVAWHNVVMPARVSVSGEKNMSASGRLAMVRDSSLYLSVRMLGMEVMALYAADDSVWVYDRMSGTLAGERLGLDPASRRRLDIHRLQDMVLCTAGTPAVMSVGAMGFELECEAGDTVSTPFGIMHDGWKASLDGTDVTAQLALAVADAQWDTERVPQWRRPRSPRRTINGCSELLKWLGVTEE